jgi:hypothetical protein
VIHLRAALSPAPVRMYRPFTLAEARVAPITRQLVCLLPCWEGSGAPNDLVRRRVSAQVGTWSGGTYGREVKTFHLSMASTADLDFTSGPWSVAVFCHLTGGPGGGAFWGPFGRDYYAGEGSNRGWRLFAAGSGIGLGSNKWCFGSYRDSNTEFPRCPGTTNWAVGDWLLVGTSDGVGTRLLYVNGVQEGTTNLNVNPLPCVTAGNLTNAGSSGDIRNYWAAAWKRCLSAAEVQSLWRNRMRTGGLTVSVQPSITRITQVPGVGARLNPRISMRFGGRKP